MVRTWEGSLRKTLPRGSAGHGAAGSELPQEPPSGFLEELSESTLPLGDSRRTASPHAPALGRVRPPLTENHLYQLWRLASSHEALMCLLTCELLVNILHTLFYWAIYLSSQAHLKRNEST